jgi:PIN domain nuclease of toxin-antitoxin system
LEQPHLAWQVEDLSVLSVYEMGMLNEKERLSGDRKEDIAQDIIDFVHQSAPEAEMKSLVRMSKLDLTHLMNAVYKFGE